MEKNSLSAEDSIDSIPGPAYERIVTTPTDTLTSAAKISNNVPENNEPGVVDELIMEMEEDEECSDIDVDDEEDIDMEDDQDDVEEDEQAQDGGEDESSNMEDDCSERDDFKENERVVKQEGLMSGAVQAAPTVAALPATAPANEQVSNAATTSSAVTTNTIVSSTAQPTMEAACDGSKKTSTLTEQSPAAGEVDACPVPVQIVSAVAVKPKMLPVKTKNNKLIMVQLINDKQPQQPVAEQRTVTSAPAAEQNLAESTKAAINEIVGSVISDASKAVMSSEEKKTSNTVQQQQQPQQKPEQQSQTQQQQQQQPQQQPQPNSRFFAARSSTPLSREFLALQRSVNESKVLSEFVTDTVRKRQKGTPKDANEQSPSSHNQHQQQQQQQPHLQQQQHHHHHHHHHNSNPEKQRKSGKFAPLKDDGNSSSTVSSLARRSRSKSVNRKNSETLESTPTTGGKLRRWPSDEKMSKRTNMRSQNSEFVQKQIEFLNRVKLDEGEVSSEADDGERNYLNGGEDDESNMAGEHNMLLNDSNASATAGIMVGGCGTTSSLLDAPLERETGGSNNGGGNPLNKDSVVARLMAYWTPPPKSGWDSFCWKCRECADLFACSKCLRSFHCTCIKVTASTKLDDTWVCPECVNVENVLNGPKRSRRGEMSLDLLSQLLSFALKRMKLVKGYSKFLYTEEDLSHYSKYIVNPVTFNTLQDKVEKRVFRCSEEFLNETKWILHNALILSSGAASKEVFTAKAILKVCRQEANEIDTCGECYLNANTRSDWFVDVCSQPHLLLWAKLKGFPYWPAKAMGPGQGLSHVNVRFFGEHDRAYVPVKDCFLYSEQDPNTQTGKRSARELADCIKEVELHIANIKKKVGAFTYAKVKTPYEPAEELQQLEMMMPGVTDFIKKQQALLPKPPLQYKIVKTADNHLSIIKKASATESSGNDSDNSASPSKKASCANIGSINEVKPSLIASKYEVVSKASSDDSNSSKVTAVILKRKSSSERKIEGGGGEDLELPMPKMIKFDDEEVDSRMQVDVKMTSGSSTNTNATSGKRKLGADTGSPNASVSSVGNTSCTTTKNTETERQRTKHAKHEPPPRVPLLTIKTNAKELTASVDTKAKVSAAAATDANNSKISSTPLNTTTATEVQTSTPTVAKEEFITTTIPTVQTNNAQTMMEILVKNKHGVTIKKISKDVAATKSTDEAAKPTLATKAAAKTKNAQAQKPVEGKKAAVEAGNGTQQNNSNNTSGSSSKNQKTNSSSSPSGVLKREEGSASAGKSAANTHILKDLVPFVEIKKEVASDDETDIQTAAKSGKQTNKKSTSANAKATAVTPLAAVTVPAPKPPMPAPLPPPNATSTGLQPNLLLVKKEVMSDEEETQTSAGVAATGLANTSIKQTSLSNSMPTGDKTSGTQSPNTTTQASLPDAVRVGDTMIQRVNVKSTRSLQPTLVSLKSPAQVAQEAAAAMDAATAAVAAAMNTSPPGRRPNTRGVPYGPLPATAIAQTQPQKLTVTLNNTMTSRTPVQQQQPQQQQQQPPPPPSQALIQPSLQVSLQPAQQRARKSFTNRGTPDISPVRNIISAAALPSPTGLPPSSTSPATANNDMKRTLLKNSMVSIPRQAWSPHESAQRNTNVGNNNNTPNQSTHSIPVPPLTAVSKTPTVVASLSGGDINSIGNPNTNNNNTTNMTCNPSNSIGNVTINSTPIASPFVSCNGSIGPNAPTLFTPLTMSAPPPLAGLSQPSINILAPSAVVSMAAGLPILSSNNSISSSGSTSIGSISISSAMELSAQTVIATTSSSISAMASTSYTDFVTPTMAAMVTDAICRGPPKMVQRPNGPLQSDGATMFPSQAGPVCQTLVDNAHKLTDFFISVMEDTMVEMSVGEEPVLQAKITLLKMELERTKQAYEQEIAELKRTSDLMICEMRKSMENEKTRIANEIRKQCEQERLRSIEETKKKQWCSNCGREAQFYCCWNTSYCDYPCQQMHWSRHSATCAQTRPTTASATDSLAKQPASTMTTTVSSLGQQQQHLQLGIGKVSSSGILTVTPATTSMAVGQQQQTTTHYNKNAMNNNNNKKDKHVASKICHQLSVANSIAISNSLATMATANAAGVSVSASATTELLKLPSNTYLRTVPQSGNNGGNSNSGGGTNVRGSTYAVQRVNIPLPITALVQRGNSWELTSAAPNNNAGNTNMGTITAPGSNVSPALSQLTSQQQQHQQRMMSGSAGTTNMPRGNSRNRAAAAQATMATMHGTTTTGGGASTMSCGVKRSTQM